MAAVSGTATTFNLPNYLGELFHITPFDTPLLSMIGGLNGGDANSTKEDVWQTDDNTAAAQSAALEGADPAYEERDRAEVSNVKQIYQYGFSVTYTKQAATGNLSSTSLDITGVQPVTDELTRQRTLKMRRMARDVEYTFLHGTYAKPADNSSPRTTRGMDAAITTNTVAAGAADLSKAMIDELLREMAASGAPFDNVVLFANAFNRQQISNIYGYAPESRNVGGLSIEQVETDFARFGVVYDRHLDADTVLLLDVAHIMPTHLVIPGKGMVFVEPLAHTGSAWNFQLYGEIGLKYGPELWHGSITGTSTS
jgi:hypothetical protein